MKAVVMVALMLGTNGRLTAQSTYFRTTTFSDVSVQRDSGLLAPFTPQLPRPAQTSVGVAVRSTDSVRARAHYARNGAILGGSLGFIAGAIGGSLLSNTCDNCSRERIGGSILAVGVAGGLVGAILGGIAGEVVGWTRR
jgi:hypothetical protein